MKWSREDEDRAMRLLGLSEDDWNTLRPEVMDKLCAHVSPHVARPKGVARPPYRLGREADRDQTYVPRGSIYVLDADGDIMGLVCWNVNSGDRQANAEFMVSAMNEKALALPLHEGSGE